jgi:hypothetical protein
MSDPWRKSPAELKERFEAAVADPDHARAWVERAAAYVRTLPPKSPKPRRPKAKTA